MATLEASSTMSMSQIQFSSRRSVTRSVISLPRIQNPGSAQISLPKSLIMSSASTLTKSTTTAFPDISINCDDQTVVLSKLYAIMEAVADRVEMHRNIGAQRDNWNSLLLTSVNSITLAAAAMSGVASASAAAAPGSPALALKLGASVLYVAATGMLAAMNKIQPSQLAEEQRNAARLFEQLRNEIQTKLSLGSVTASDVSEAAERVLALDKAYPLPLLGAMLEKFPKKVEPAVWWPRKKTAGRQRSSRSLDGDTNGWSSKLEEEMREIRGVIERRDVDEYLKLSEKALKFNKFLAISGPVLTGFAAVGTALSGHFGALPGVIGVVGGALASVVNALEHGGQVGMVFEMYRSNAGFFRLIEETIESNLKERDVQRRENGEVLEMKLALQLGRSLSELRNLADKSRSRKSHDHEEEFASKLF